MKLVKNQAQNSVDLYVYGEIVNEKWYESDVDSSDFRNAFEEMASGDTLNIYINSGGGSVFTAVAICSIIDRLKAKGITVNGFIDGISASAATFITMACDSIVAYKSSMMMIHKPMSYAFGNADDLMKTVETLNQIQTETMLPLYRSKAKVSDEEILDMVDTETWLSASDMEEVFDISIQESSSEMVAMDRSLFKNYKNVPDALINEPEDEDNPLDEGAEGIENEIDDAVPFDFSVYNAKLRLMKEV